MTRNIEKYFEIEIARELDDSFRERLLKADLSDENRLKKLREMNFAALPEMPARAALVGGILARTGKKFDDFGIEAARAVIVSSRPLATQVALFNMFHELFDDGQVTDILKGLPNPLPDIKPGFATPKIEGSEVNLRFVTWLKDRGFISSWRQGGFFDDDIRMNMFRK